MSRDKGIGLLDNIDYNVKFICGRRRKDHHKAIPRITLVGPRMCDSPSGLDGNLSQFGLQCLLIG